MTRFTRSRMQTFVAFICFAALSACDRLISETAVPVPVDGTEMVVRYQGRVMDMPYFEAVFRNSNGELRHQLWDDWGPAKSGNVYQTPNGHIVIIGGGGRDYMFATTGHKKPRFIAHRRRPGDDGSSWTYLGLFVANDGNLRFYDSREMPETIPLFGAGSSPYRTAFQD